jgi:hypothetical protein
VLLIDLTIFAMCIFKSCDCKNNGFKGLCKTDPTMGYLKIRYYDIIVTATDFAGNTDSDTCKVVIIPQCDHLESESCVEYNGAFYYNVDAVDENVSKSKLRYEVAKEETVWERGLQLPDPSEEVGQAVDVDNDPPIVNCTLSTQALLGNGAGVFTDLGFNFTAVDTGKKCTDTEDLEVSIEVLSNEVVTTGEEVSFVFLT